jgi:hypothetical protein
VRSADVLEVESQTDKRRKEGDRFTIAGVIEAQTETLSDSAGVEDSSHATTCRATPRSMRVSRSACLRSGNIEASRCQTRAEATQPQRGWKQLERSEKVP